MSLGRIFDHDATVTLDFRHDSRSSVAISRRHARPRREFSFEMGKDGL